MPRHKIKSISFIEACEEYRRLQCAVANTIPACSLFDVIDGSFVIPEKTKSKIRKLLPAGITIFIYGIPFSWISDRGAGVCTKTEYRSRTLHLEPYAI